MPAQVKMGEPFAPPPPPVYETQIEAPATLPQYQIRHSRVGLWFEGEVVDAGEFEGGTPEIQRLLRLGAIGPVTQPGAAMSFDAALARTGGAAVITRPTTEQLVAQAVAALKQG
jgi:hypothetical protein